MAVFWFGWTKKLKNIFTKKEADTLYLQKNNNQSQTVAGPVSFSQGVIARSSIDLGTEIKAGYGGGSVKFIPEDNSTKTLQFYNNNPGDTRRFNLLVSNPTAAQNPATKQYVDTKIGGPTLLGTLTLNNQNPNNRSITTTRFNTNYPLYFEVCLNQSNQSFPHNQIFFCPTITPHNTSRTYKLLDERYLDVRPGGSWSENLVLFVEVNSTADLKFLSNDSQTAYQYIKIYGTPAS